MLKDYSDFPEVFESKSLQISIDDFWHKFLSDDAKFGLDKFYRSIGY